MSTADPRRLLLAVLCLTGTTLACARAEIPFEPNRLSVATALVIPPTLTLPPVALASPTSELAEGAGGPTSTPSATAAPSATPAGNFSQAPVPNGTFDTDLSNWNATPNWALWQDGYVRLNAVLAAPGAQIAQLTDVPSGSEVRLHFAARSEGARGGECVIESHLGQTHAFAADAEWHEQTVDFSLQAGTQAAVSLQTRDTGNCDWVHVDDVYWLVAADGGAVSASTPTPEAATGYPAAQASPTTAPTAVADIPAGATFTRDLAVIAVGDTPVGAPADIVDGQTLTWASLRNGSGAWVFGLDGARTVAGVRLVAQRDGNADTLLLGIDVSTDGLTWTEVYRAAGSCGSTANCEVLAQGTPVELAFAPRAAQYVRLRSGPSRFALAEVALAIVE